MPADNKRKSFNKKGRLVGNDLARIKRLIQQYSSSGGGTVVPTEVFPIVQQCDIGGAQVLTNIEKHTGCTLGTSIAASSLTTSVSLTGPARIDFLTFFGTGAGAANALEAELVIDGVTVYTGNPASMQDDDVFCFFGSYYATEDASGVENTVFTTTPVDFTTSLVLKLADGGSKPIQSAYRYFKT